MGVPDIGNTYGPTACWGLPRPPDVVIILSDDCCLTARIISVAGTVRVYGTLSARASDGVAW